CGDFQIMGASFAFVPKNGKIYLRFSGKGDQNRMATFFRLRPKTFKTSHVGGGRGQESFYIKGRRFAACLVGNDDVILAFSLESLRGGDMPDENTADPSSHQMFPSLY